MQSVWSSKAQLRVVEFKKFAVSGTTARLRTFCYKADGASKEVKVGQLAQRVFKAQVLASSTPDTHLQESQQGNKIAMQPSSSPEEAHASLYHKGERA